MGVYQYTRRAETKTVEGVRIGRFDFAYKLGSCGWHPSNEGNWTSSNRTVKVMEAHAERALAKTRDVKYFIIGKFNNLGKHFNRLPVYEINDISQFTEELGTPPVGWLIREGKSLRFEFEYSYR